MKGLGFLPSGEGGWLELLLGLAAHISIGVEPLWLADLLALLALWREEIEDREHHVFVFGALDLLALFSEIGDAHATTSSPS